MQGSLIGMPVPSAVFEARFLAAEEMPAA
jgi:hypothetical protein